MKTYPAGDLSYPLTYIIGLLSLSLSFFFQAWSRSGEKQTFSANLWQLKVQKGCAQDIVQVWLEEYTVPGWWAARDQRQPLEKWIKWGKYISFCDEITWRDAKHDFTSVQSHCFDLQVLEASVCMKHTPYHLGLSLITIRESVGFKRLSFLTCHSYSL